ncbi:MAG: right-handed parallel beta-helix repeat-containing protein [bacterium]|nr:right-handed parallel beta-helix repeat-containing protein [bacterium]
MFLRTAFKRTFNGRSIALTCVAALAVLGCPGVAPVVIYVNTAAHAAPASQDGLSWGTAFDTIQEGLDTADAAGGGEVWVARGIYDEERPDDPDGSLVMRPGVDLYGGFLGIEVLRTCRDWEENGTVIDGANGLVTKASSNAYHVVKGANDATLDGFSIVGGDSSGASGEPQILGAGMYNNSASPVVENCVFWGNHAVSAGGGMFNDASSPTVTNCTFESNIGVGAGGGMYNDASSPTLTRCIFTNNSAAGVGGGMYNGTGSSTVVTHTTFMRNQAAGSGGTISNDSSSFTLTNCIVAYGLAWGAGGGMANGSSSVAITNCTFYGNYVAGTGGAVSDDGTDTTIVNSVFWNNKSSGTDDEIPAGVADVTFSCVAGGYAGDGNTAADPLFTDEFNSDFRLASGSPCADTGTAAGAPSDDIRGASRPRGSGYDMGAYERQSLF